MNAPQMAPAPRRQDPIVCPDCGTSNDTARGGGKCRNCQYPLPRSKVTSIRADAMRAAAQVLETALARMATLTDREAALEAYTPGGPSVDELEAKICALRKPAAANAA